MVLSVSLLILLVVLGSMKQAKWNKLCITLRKRHMTLMFYWICSLGLGGAVRITGSKAFYRDY